MAAALSSMCSTIIELNGDDLRREPLERRKAALAKLLARAGYGVQLNEHLEAGAGGVRSCLPHGARRDRVEAQGLVVSVISLNPGFLRHVCWERAAGCILGMVMKVAPNCR
jgi:hypothetical protein